MSRRFLVILLLAVPLGALAQEVQPGQVIETEVLTVRAPGSTGWSLTARSPARVSFAKLGHGPNATLAAMAVAFRIEVPRSKEHFLELVKRGVAADTPALRFRPVRESFTHEEAEGSQCVRYVGLHEDLQAKTFVAPRGPIQMQSHTLYCLHPHEAGVAFAAGYSHRGELTHAAMDPEAREFIAGAGLRMR